MMGYPRYYVLTWDSDLQAFTPQQGVRKGPYTQFGLRKALHKLREMGYEATHEDNSMYVYRVDAEDNHAPLDD